MSTRIGMNKKGSSEIKHKSELMLYPFSHVEDGKLSDETLQTVRNVLEAKPKEDFKHYVNRFGLKMEIDKQLEQLDWFSYEDILTLKACAGQPFHFGGCYTLEGLLKKLKVKINILSGLKYSKRPPVVDEDGEEDETTVVVWGDEPMWGQYLDEQNVINLYPEAMHMVFNGERVMEILVATLAHEAMHAYFNRKAGGRDKLPFVLYAEEPMAEFGSLLFLREANMPSYYEWASDMVGRKQTCYRYGWALLQQHLHEEEINRSKNAPNPSQTLTREDLEKYKFSLSGTD